MILHSPRHRQSSPHRSDKQERRVARYEKLHKETLSRKTQHLGIQNIHRCLDHKNATIFVRTGTLRIQIRAPDHQTYPCRAECVRRNRGNQKSSSTRNWVVSQI